MAQNQQPNVQGMVTDPAFQKLNPNQQRQALFGLTNDKAFQSLSNEDLGGFVYGMQHQPAAVPKAISAPKPAPTTPTQNGSSNPVQAGAIRSFASGVGVPERASDILTGPAYAIAHPIESGKLLYDAQKQQTQELMDRAYELQHSPGLKNKMAGILTGIQAEVPFMGGQSALMSQQIAAGNYRGAIGTGAALALPIEEHAAKVGLGSLRPPVEAPVAPPVADVSARNAEIQASANRMPPEFETDSLASLRDRAQKIIDNPKATPEERSVAQGLKQHIEERLTAQTPPAPASTAVPSEPHPAELRNSGIQFSKDTNGITWASNKNLSPNPVSIPDEIPSNERLSYAQDKLTQQGKMAAALKGRLTASDPNPLDVKLQGVPKENLAPLRDELKTRANDLQAQAKNIRDLDSQFSKNAANAQALIDMKKTGGPVRQIATPEGERITIKPDAELGVHARNVLGPLEGKEARFSDADLQSSKFDRTKPTNVSDEDWNKALSLAKAKFFRDRNTLVKDIDVANSTGHAVEETDIPERLKDLDQTGQLIWKLPAGETGNKVVTQAPAPEHILRTWDTKTQEAATGKNLKNFNNGKLLNSAQLEQIAKDKEAMAQEHLALANHIDQKLAAPKQSEYLYHATDVSRVPSIEEQGLRKGAWFAKSPEDALRSGAVPVSGNKADLRLFRVPANEVVPGTPDAADIGAREVEKGRFVQSQVPHPNAEQVDMKGLPIRERISANAKILQETINPTNLKTRADMTKALDTASDILVKDANPRMLHAVADASTLNVANALGMTPDDLFREEAHPQLTDVKVVAADLALKHNLDNVFNIAEQARTGAVSKDAFFEAMAKHAALQEVVDKKIGKEAGRIFRARQIVKDEALQEAALDRATSRPKAMRRAAFDMIMKLSDAKKQQAIEAFLKIPKDDTFATAKFIRDFARFQEASKLGRFQNAARELYLNSLLSGPVGIIKASSDAAMALMTPWLNGLRDVIETKQMSALPKDVGIQYHALLSSFPSAVKAMAESWHTELGSSSEFEPRQFTIGGTAGRVVRVPTRIAAAVNDFFYTVQREMELRLLASRHAESLGLKGRAATDHINQIVSNPSPEFYRRATNTATINTFNNRIGGSIGSLIKTLREFPGGWWMMPIVKIPTNLAKFGIDLTPLGFAHAELIRRAESSGEGRFATSPISASTAQSRAIMGTAALVWAYNMARQGKLSGNGPSDYKERERLEATGWQPNSIKVGSNWISYKKLEPIATPLMAAGTFHDAITYDKTKPDQSILTHGLLNTLSNEFQTMPFLQSLAAVQTWIAGGPEAAHSLTQFALQTGGSVVPTGVADMAHAIDSTYRKPTTLTQEIESRVPGLTQNVPAVTDVTGQPVKRPVGAVGGWNPFPVSPEVHNEVAGEIERLKQTKPQTGPTVTLPRTGLPRGVAAVKIQITDSEKIALNHQDAQISAARKRALMDSPIYRQMTDDQKREAFTRIDRQTKESRANRLSILRQGAGK